MNMQDHQSNWSQGRIWTLTAAALLTALLLPSCETPLTNTGPGFQSAPPPRVTLGAGDVIKVMFSDAPDLNQSQKIRTDGRLSLPQIGEVVAAGKTLARLQAELSARYRPVLQSSDVLITLESGPTHIYLTGAIGRPGPLVVERPTTLLQAIMQAGGPNQFANMRRVQIIRMTNGRERSQVIDMRPALAGRAAEPFYVRDGDIISIPHSAF